MVTVGFKPPLLFTGALALCALFSACEREDVGKACPDPNPPAAAAENDSDNEIEAPATVRKDAACDTFVCLSTQVRKDYCSKECRSDRQCPDGFLCQQLQPVGPLKDNKYCVLGKACTTNNDCPKDRMLCLEVATSNPEQPAFFCDLK